MNTTPMLWRTRDGSVVVSSLIPLPWGPNNYEVQHRPATTEDLTSLNFLIPEHDEDPYFE